MSSEQAVDQELIDQTKQQIRVLVSEIAKLTKSDVGVTEFYGQFLERVVQALAAVGGAVWAPGDDGRIDVQHQINLAQTGLTDSRDDQVRHGRLIQKVYESGEGMLAPPQSGGGGDDAAGNPTDFLLVFAPLMTDTDVAGVVEIFQRPGTRPNTQRGYLRFLRQMCELASDFLKTRRLRHYSDRQVMWSQLENFTRAAHQTLDPKQAAYTIANEGRRLIECDRVSVAIRHGNKCTIEAISGQDVFDKRSNVVTLLNRLTTAVVRTGEPMWYTGDTSDMAPQVENAVEAYVDESHSKTVAVLPLIPPETKSEVDDPDAKPPRPVGALVVEQIEDSRPREGMDQRIEVVRDHSSTALANSLEHQGLFLMPLWRAIGRASWIVQARTLPKTLAILAVVLAAIAALVIVPGDFTIEARGELQPVIRRDVFGPLDGGKVRKIHVEHGQSVTAGELLLELDNVDLKARKAEIEGQIEATEEVLNSRNVLLNSSGQALPWADEVRITGERDQAQAQLKSLHEQWILFEQKELELEVLSPISGIITTWDVERTLKSRPVQPGNVVLVVADPSGDWELVIQLEEDRMGHIGRAQKELGEELDVEFILQSEPGVTHRGKIKEVDYNAEVRGEEGSTVRVKVAIDKEAIGQLLPGATVTTQFHCGRRAIGYCYLHDLWEFMQKQVFFRFF